jgi:hypothetical protein
MVAFEASDEVDGVVAMRVKAIHVMIGFMSSSAHLAAFAQAGQGTEIFSHFRGFAPKKEQIVAGKSLTRAAAGAGWR